MTHQPGAVEVAESRPEAGEDGENVEATITHHRDLYLPEPALAGAARALKANLPGQASLSTGGDIYAT
ncbi:MAG: hypothetical protein ACRDZ8_13275 [Acidimicrobiales bacterium]